MVQGIKWCKALSGAGIKWCKALSGAGIKWCKALSVVQALSGARH